MSFNDDLRKEMLEDNPNMKTLLDWIDERIDIGVQQILDNTEYATKEDVENMIHSFNDR